MEGWKTDGGGRRGDISGSALGLARARCSGWNMNDVAMRGRVGHLVRAERHGEASVGLASAISKDSGAPMHTLSQQSGSYRDRKSYGTANKIQCRETLTYIYLWYFTRSFSN